MSDLLEQILLRQPNSPQQEPRGMGVEIELAGLEPQRIAEVLIQSLGGHDQWLSPFEIQLTDTELGDIKLELDSQQIKELGEKSAIQGNPEDDPQSFEKLYIQAISTIAINLVPWEIVTAPIPFKDLPRLEPVIEALREAGAQGTRHAVHYAFGVHLNPELVDHSAEWIIAQMKSFFCLYDWIRKVERTDFSRRVTPYINHFAKEYVCMVLDADYQPTTEQLIDDYLRFNATRNRSLDLLPLFKFLDKERVAKAVQDQRVNARPTFHFRLPNCDIDNPEWGLNISIDTWMAVEGLAQHPSLQTLCERYLSKLQSIVPLVPQLWADEVEHHLDEIDWLPNFQ